MNGISKSRCRKSAFTLIELLVVIAIIAILAAILFPVFAQAREKARQTACLSNEKQINLAVLQYIQDNDEAWPQAVQGPGGNYTGDKSQLQTWSFVIQPYIKSTQVWICPSQPSAPSIWYNTQDIPRTYEALIQFNGANGAIGQDTAIINDDGGNQGPIAEAAIPEPSNTLWMTESGQNRMDYNGACFDSPCRLALAAGNGNGFYVNDRFTWPFNAQRPNVIAHNHTGGTNWCYADGHVKFALLSQLITYDRTKDPFLRIKM